MNLGIAVDTETTGLDFNHGTRPYLVTICENKVNTWWEWDVDPLTRKPLIPLAELNQVRKVINKSEGLILQNAVFDVLALGTINVTKWPWYKTIDTLFAAHLLDSVAAHDLTSLALKYLGVDIAPFDRAMEKAVKDCHRIVRKKYPKWRIAKKGEPDMPSVKGKTWKQDAWLPRCLAKHEKYTKDHPYYTVTSEYANIDSLVTEQLGYVMKRHLKEEGLEDIYEFRLKLLPILHKMQTHGVSLNAERHRELTHQYQDESRNFKTVCVNFARGRGFKLELPKSGVNNSLREFMFSEHPGLDLEVVQSSAKTGNPSLNAEAMDTYLNELDPKTMAFNFIKALKSKRQRDTALMYLNGYEDFRILEVKHNEKSNLWYKLFPTLNPTGTNTLRWTSSNPNEQNISKREGFNLRYCFGPLPGREWWALDANNIELRIPAYESGEKALIELFEEPNKPPYYGSVHLLNFHTVYPDLWEHAENLVGINEAGKYCKKEYPSTWYQWCKNGGFAVQYGAVNKIGGTADKAFRRDGSHQLLKERFDKQTALNDKWVEYAKDNGYVETMPDLTVDPDRGYPLTLERDYRGNIKPTLPLNYHVQGTAMWWMGKAMIRCQCYIDKYNKGKPRNFHIHMIMQVHDEIVFDVPRNIKRSVIVNLKNLMELGGSDLGLPTPVSMELHRDNWSTGQTI